MSEIIFTIIKVLMFIAALAAIGYLMPYLEERVGAERLETITKWVRYAVLKAQQVFYNETGESKKAYVTSFLKELLTQKNITLTDEQLDTLIEAAVKQMKIEEAAGKGGVS